MIKCARYQSLIRRYAMITIGFISGAFGNISASWIARYLLHLNSNSESCRRMQVVHTALFLLVVVATAGAGAGAGPRDASYRLPGDVVPLHYAVHVAPRIPGNGATDHLYYDGAVDISAYVLHDTPSILMHAGQNIEITKLTVKRENALVDSTWTKIEEQEFISISLSDSLKVKEEINIQITYRATYPERMEGFYKSTYNYTDNKGEIYERVLFATQFEPTYARKAFPAFDEPGYKATFQLSIDPPPGFSALSNTPIHDRKIRNENGRKIDTIVFQETPRMSVYLLAFLVYEEDTYTHTTTTDTDVPITSWAPKGDIDAGQAEFSQSETPKILSVMEDYTGIPFAQGNVRKIDEVAIPDFTAGAMENWGLITYREDTLLVDPEQGTAHDRQYVSEVISHEIAHQWFGNLVSPKWWDYAWLSEGFARYFQYWISGQVNPDWRMDEQLLVDIQQSIFEVDALPSALALTTEVNTPDEIVERFGAMSYNKGSAVVRMIKNILGEENFQKALQFYLDDRKFDNATPEDLFAAFQKFAPSDVSPEFLGEALAHWTQRPGFPVLTLDAWSADTVFVTQKRFNLSAASDSQLKELYYVQYQIHHQSGASTPRLWSTPNNSIEYHALEESTEQWLVVNSTGYFRVNYWAENWQRLGAALRLAPSVLAPVERAQLVDDALNLARAALLPYVTALDFTRYLAHETDYLPWKAAFSGLDFLGRLLANEDEDGLFPAFLLELLEGVYARLGFADEGSHLDKLLRAQVLARACGAAHARCLEESRDRLVAFLRQGREIEPDLRSVVYCYGVKEEGNDVWEQLLGRLQITDNPGERSSLISALGCSNDVDILLLYLEYSLDPNVVRPQDAAAVFTAVYSNPRGVDPALDFLVDRFADIQKAYANMRDINNIVRGIAMHLTNERQKEKMIQFLNFQASVLGESGQIAESTVLANVEWLSNRKEEVLGALRHTDLL